MTNYAEYVYMGSLAVCLSSLECFCVNKISFTLAICLLMNIITFISTNGCPHTVQSF